MRNQNIIGIYSTVITDPKTQYRFGAQFADATREGEGGEGPRDVSKVEPIKMTKLVLKCAHPSYDSLKRAYPHLHQYMETFEVQSLARRGNDVHGNVCVHLDPLIGEVLGLQCNILTSKLEGTAARLTNELRTTERALSVQTDLAAAYKKRVDDFNNLGVWTKLLHVVIAWLKEHKAV